MTQHTEGQASRTLLEVLKKYQPGSRLREILTDAVEFSMRADKEKRMLEISVTFSSVVDKEDLYEIEEGIRKAYELSYVKLLPHYPNADGNRTGRNRGPRFFQPISG